MSHCNHELMRQLVATIRQVEAEEGHPIGILVDLQGPKLGSACSPTRPST